MSHAAADPVPVLLMARALNLGGSERQLVEIALALDRRRFNPAVACFQAAGMRLAELRRAGVKVVDLGVDTFRPPRSVVVSVNFVRLLRKTRPAIVHPFDVPTVLFAVPLARVAGIPVVLSSQRGDRGLFSAVQRFGLRLTDPVVDGIVVNSEYVRKLLVEQSSLAPQKIFACRNAIDTGVFHTHNRQRVAGLSAASGCIIGTIAALRVEKSIETLVDAFARLDGDHRLLIVGDGPCREPLMQRARAAGLGERCVFVPETPDVSTYYRSIDIFVLPSINESFSNSLMEAMACGCAVVASQVGGNAELVEDGRNGFLFRAGSAEDLAEKIDALLKDPPLRRQLAREGAAAVHRRHSRAAAVQCFEDLYRRLLERQRRG